jgi:hypothetical protein
MNIDFNNDGYNLLNKDLDLNKIFQFNLEYTFNFDLLKQVLQSIIVNQNDLNEKINKHEKENKENFEK